MTQAAIAFQKPSSAFDVLPEALYHAAPWPLLDNILATGLQPEKCSQGILCLARSPWLAKSMALIHLTFGHTSDFSSNGRGKMELCRETDIALIKIDPVMLDASAFVPEVGMANCKYGAMTDKMSSNPGWKEILIKRGSLGTRQAIPVNNSMITRIKVDHVPSVNEMIQILKAGDPSTGGYQ